MFVILLPYRCCQSRDTACIVSLSASVREQGKKAHEMCCMNSYPRNSPSRADAAVSSLSMEG